MSVTFTNQTTTNVVGGNGGSKFQDVPGNQQVLIGIQYDCRSFNPDADDYPTWTIIYKFLRAIQPVYAKASSDGSVTGYTVGTQRGGHNGEFVIGGVCVGPPGYVVTGMNVRWDSTDDGVTLVKAFQLQWMKWNQGGTTSTQTATWSPWHGGDGKIPQQASYDQAMDPSPNAPTPTSSTGFNAGMNVPSTGGCFVGLAGSAGDQLDALGAVWAKPTTGS
ncbi:hypothetical protein C1H76_7998 [Elsinoe australis]|uniref:Uncharacterized protein n=1 Tax=Elsinoe australis TaxID=40998 RepID=A0A2P8AFH7_9PEZI|nr:hypothetical protein B9Z65_3538 [Elsinoe australis]TKX19800.1 hypothetical protein C1H76_7998 [Elsinoe australis]